MQKLEPHPGLWEAKSYFVNLKNILDFFVMFVSLFCYKTSLLFGDAPVVFGFGVSWCVSACGAWRVMLAVPLVDFVRFCLILVDFVRTLLRSCRFKKIVLRTSVETKRPPPNNNKSNNNNNSITTAKKYIIDMCIYYYV